MTTQQTTSEDVDSLIEEIIIEEGPGEVGEMQDRLEERGCSVYRSCIYVHLQTDKYEGHTWEELMDMYDTPRSPSKAHPDASVYQLADGEKRKEQALTLEEYVHIKALYNEIPDDKDKIRKVRWRLRDF